MNRTSEKLIITRTGQARGLVGPLVGQVTKLLGPNRVTRRASHVEPPTELSDEAVRWLWDRQLLGIPSNMASYALPFDAATCRVEMDPDAWWADMHPCGHAAVLGPFATNTEALAAEKAWLLAHDIPTVGN